MSREGEKWRRGVLQPRPAQAQNYWHAHLGGGGGGGGGGEGGGGGAGGGAGGETELLTWREIDEIFVSWEFF